MKIQGLLPIGSVVMLQGGEHRLMVTGYAQKLQNTEKVTDYVGVLWPEGFMRPDQNYLFNSDNIEDVHFLGYQTDGQKVFIARMEAALNDYRQKDGAQA